MTQRHIGATVTYLCITKRFVAYTQPPSSCIIRFVLLLKITSLRYDLSRQLHNLSVKWVNSKVFVTTHLAPIIYEKRIDRHFHTVNSISSEGKVLSSKLFLYLLQTYLNAIAQTSGLRAIFISKTFSKNFLLIKDLQKT